MAAGDPIGSSTPPQATRSSEIARDFRALMDIYRVTTTCRYLIRHRSDLRYFRLYKEHGEKLFELPGWEDALHQPGDHHLSGMLGMIETGLVVTYMRPFTTGRGSGFPLENDVLPLDDELRRAHAELRRLRDKVYAHVDDEDSPAPRVVQWFMTVDGEGNEIRQYQEVGGLVFTEAALELLERLAHAVADKLRARPEEAKLREAEG